MAPFPVRTNPRWRLAPSRKNFKWPYLRNRRFMFGSRVGFSGTADLMVLLLPTTCTANLLCFRRQHHITSLLMRKTLELDFVWAGSLQYLGYTGFNARNKIAAFNWHNLRIANNAQFTLFGTNAEFSGLADRVDLLPVELNQIQEAAAGYLGKFRMNIGRSVECII